MLRLDVRVDLPDVQRLLRRLEPEQRAEALETIGEEGQNLARDSFMESRDPYGNEWPPLKQSTLKSYVTIPGIAGRRRREAFGLRPLVRTTDLMNSVNWQHVERGVSVAIGSSVRYAVYHQGDPNHVDKGIVPRRRFLPDATDGLPPVWRSAFLEAVEEYLEGGETP